MIIVLQSCENQGPKIGRLFPNRPSKEFKKELRGADVSPDFKQGWEDGCEVGMAGGANNFYRMFYKNNKLDGFKMTQSGDYANGWSNAFWYCYRVDDTKIGASAGGGTLWSSMFGGYR